MAVIYRGCASCHKLFNKGGNIGPDLTTYQRDNLGTTLVGIVDPNAEIREGFEYYIAQTNDGLTFPFAELSSKGAGLENALHSD